MVNGTDSKNGSHDAAAAIRGHDPLWDGLLPAAVKALGESLDPALVSHRKGRGGRSFAYLEGRTAIDQANRVFGHGGWGYDLVGEVSQQEIESVDPKTGEVKRARAYAATVRVTVPGVPSRTDMGFHADRGGERRRPRDGLQGRGDRRPQARPARLRRPVREQPLRRRVRPAGRRAGARRCARRWLTWG